LHKYRKFWEQQLDRLAGYLDNLSRESKEPK
jgi:hypothetical protein